VLGREGGAVGREGGGIPISGERFGEGLEGIGELKGLGQRHVSWCAQ
jgi:hypothetical protein